MAEQSNQYVVVAGNPEDGFSYIGPFADPREAAAWAEGVCDEDDWWVSDLLHPLTIYSS
jgi:hypothetical protein